MEVPLLLPNNCLPKTSKIVCRICLLSDIERNREIDDSLTEFYDELIYFDTREHAALTVCPCCEHRLRKFYNFRQQCRRAHILLKTWSTDLTESKPLEDLQKMLPISSLGMCTTGDDQVLDCIWPEHEHEVAAQHSEGFGRIGMDCEVSSQSSDQFEVTGRFATWIGERSTYDKENNNKLNTTENQKTSRSDNLTSYLQGFVKSKLQANVQETQMELQSETEHFGDADYPESCAGGNDTQILTSNYNFYKKKPRPSEMTEKWAFDIRNIRKKELLKKLILKLLERGELQGISDLGVSLDKEVFLEIFEKCPEDFIIGRGLMDDNIPLPKLRAFLQCLLRNYNPNAIFSVECLDSHEKRVAEFNSRHHSIEYLEAHHRCEICYKVWATKGLLESHKRQHNSQNQYLDHMNSHTGAKPYRCGKCDARFTSQVLANSHALQHRPRHSCNHCHMEFRTKKLLDRHFYQRLKSKEIPRLQCDVCGKEYKHRDGIIWHFRHGKHKQKQLGREKPRPKQRKHMIQDNNKTDHVRDDESVNQKHVQDDESVNQEHVQDDDSVNLEHVQDDDLVNQEHVQDDETLIQDQSNVLFVYDEHQLENLIGQ